MLTCAFIELNLSKLSAVCSRFSVITFIEVLVFACFFLTITIHSDAMARLRCDDLR